MKRTYDLGKKSGWKCNAWVWTEEHDHYVEQMSLILRFTKGESIHQLLYKMESTVCCVKEYSHLEGKDSDTLSVRVIRSALRRVRKREGEHGHDGYDIIKQFDPTRRRYPHVCKRDESWDWK